MQIFLKKLFFLRLWQIFTCMSWIKKNNTDMKIKMNWLHYAEEMIAKL